MAKLASLYATALFELALEGGMVDDFLSQAALLKGALEDSDCRRILVHPHISAAEKRGFFGKAFEGHLNKEMLGLLYLAIDKNREAYLLPACNVLIGMIERHQRKATAKVLTAVALDDSQAEALRQMLSQKLHKQVGLSIKVDPSVIGGPYIYVDGYYFDRTIRSRLRGMKDFIRGHQHQMNSKERYGA